MGEVRKPAHNRFKMTESTQDKIKRGFEWFARLPEIPVGQHS